MTTDRERSFGKQQMILADEGLARGQCACGAYRLDGLPPVLHHDGCERAGGWKADPLYVTEGREPKAAL